MTSWKKPTNELIEKALDSVKKGTGRKYFFSRLENPLWLKPLADRNCFVFPPKTQRFDDGSVIYPYWHELKYLKNVCNEKPDEVINLVLDLPDTDNPVVYDGILDIALELPGEYSIKLIDKILQYAGMEEQFQTHRFANLLEHWIKDNQTSVAYELAKELIAFEPDPKSEEKQRRRIENPLDSDTLLEPSPKMTHGEYRDIMSKGILPLTKSNPYRVACILIDTTANMVSLRRHKQDQDKQDDISESWCPNLHGTNKNSQTPEETLVQTLTIASEIVFEDKHSEIENLDNILRKQHWKIFKRLRHHLYALNPNQKTKSWINELILNPKYYNQWKHSYEFRQMIKTSCEYYGETFLTKEQRAHIFDTILAGPSKANYQAWLMRWLGQEYTEQGFLEYKRLCQRIQLEPFAHVLFGKYKTRLQRLETEVKHRIFDEDYLPSKAKITRLSVSKLSPRSSEDLANFSDDVLIDYLNNWEDEDKLHEGDKLVEIDIQALAGAFQTLFRESIIPDADRLKFWMTNCNQIERPIYVRMMIKVMEAQVKEKNFNQLKQWLTFCEWVLSHSDNPHEQDYTQGDESRQDKNWTNSRRAVGDFIGVCLAEDVDVPISERKKLAKLLDMLCTQYDWNLDNNRSSKSDHNDPLIEGVNNTRSRALESLFRLGIWIRTHEPECEVPEITNLLEERFSSESDYPLTLPEYAILGKYYLTIYNFNKKWTIKHKSEFFPQSNHPEWVASFSSFFLCNGTYKPIFEILKNDFNYALQHLSDFRKHDMISRHPVDVFGERLFHYYLLDMFPLKGPESLLEKFYLNTENDPKHQANVFKIIGDRLVSTGKDLDPNIKDRVKTFFKWRLKQQEPSELQYYTVWLQAKCLEVKWRLKSYSKVIDVCNGNVDNWEIYLRELCEMLPNHTTKVVECFAKLTDGMLNNNIYIPTDEAKTIIKSGIKSTDTVVIENAKHAINNLLRTDKMEFLDLAIDKDK